MVMADHILTNSTFTDIRIQKENQIIASFAEIDTVFFREADSCWLVQGPDAIQLHRLRDALDIVIWRVPAIPQFATFSNAEELFEELYGGEAPPDGIWCVLSTPSFESMFGARSEALLSEIDLIADRNHKYLLDPETFPESSDEFKSLVSSLQKIEYQWKGSEVILCGTQKSVKCLLRRLRQKEVERTDSPFSPFSWQLSDIETCDESVIVSYFCIVSHGGHRMNEYQLMDCMAAFSDWTHFELLEDDGEPPLPPLQPPPQSDPIALSECNAVNIASFSSISRSLLIESTRKKKWFRFAMIAFHGRAGLEAFVDAADSVEGVYAGPKRLEIHRKHWSSTPRKVRTLDDGLMLV